MNSSLRLCASFSMLLISGVAHAQNGKPIHLEAEDAQLSGNVRVQTQRTGFSGAGYATGFIADGDKIGWTIPAAAPGIYQLRVRYNAPERKGYDLNINGHKISAMFAPSSAGFDTATAGRIELPGGKTTIFLEKSWGYYEIDALDLVPIAIDQKLAKPPATLSDAKATPAARALMQFLLKQYGASTLSGQFEIADSDYVTEKTGSTPAVFGGDLMDYSPSRVELGASYQGISEKYLARAQLGQIMTLCWHWNAPSHLTQFDAQGAPIPNYWWGGFYTKNTTFDLDAALANPNGEDYKLLLRDIDAIAVQLKKFSDARVPVLWRPLHEAEGGWFWWGAKGPQPFKKLWRLMYHRLTVTHNLHNLIWVYTSDGDPAWYPGDDVADIVGADCYPSDSTDPLTLKWDELNAQHGGRKLIALSEVGKVPDIAQMRRLGVKWSYFSSWTGPLGAKGVPVETLKNFYRAPGVLNLKQIRALRAAPIAAPAKRLSAPIRPR